MASEQTSPSAPPRAARRPLRAQVQRVERLTPRMLRVVVAGEDLEGFGVGAFTDHYVKLQLPPPGAEYAAPFDVEDVRARLPREQWPRTRTYTVRAWDPEQRELTIDFVHHGDTGVAGPWAAAARPGDVLQFSGPGGAYAPRADAPWHLMVGDASVLPAIAASLPRVAEGVPVRVLVDVDGPEEQQPLASPGALEVLWVTGGDALLEAVRTLRFPAGEPHVFLHGEASAVRAVRRHLVAERGLPATALSASGYWKRALDEEGWRDDKAEWARAVAEDDAVPAVSPPR